MSPTALRTLVLVAAVLLVAACTSPKVTASPSINVGALGTPVVASDVQRAQAATLGWPGRLPAVVHADYLQRRTGPPLTGHLDFLEAFATIVTTSGPVDVPRSEVGSVLLNDPTLIAPRLVSLKSDVVVTNDGHYYTGDVNVQSGTVYIAGRAFAHADVRLIHLRDPAQQSSRPPLAASSSPGASTPPSAAQASPPTSSGSAPAGTPWGQGVWRGVVDFDYTATDTDSLGGTETFTLRGQLQVTFGEAITIPVAGDPGPPQVVHFIPLSLDWHETAGMSFSGEAAMAACEASGNGSGHGWDTTAHTIGDGSIGDLKVGDQTGQDRRAIGSYDISVAPPFSYFPMSGTPPLCDVQRGSTSFFTARSSVVAADQGVQLCSSEFDIVTPPLPALTKIDGKSTGSCTGWDYTVSWTLARGPLTSSIPTPELNPCADAKAWDDYVHDRLDADVKAMRGAHTKIDEARRELARVETFKAQYHDAMTLLVIAAAGSDIAHKAMSLIVSDGAVEMSGAAEGSEYAKAMKEFQDNLSHDFELIEALINSDPQGLLTFVKPLTESDGPSAEEDATGSDDNVVDLVQAALEEFQYGQVLADVIGQGDGTAAADYIDEHLSEISGLIPDHTLQQVEAYLELTKEWKSDLADVMAAVGDAARIALDIDELRAEVKMRDAELARC